MYTFSELIWNIRKVGKIDSRKMQGRSAFSSQKIAEKGRSFLSFLFHEQFCRISLKKIMRISEKFFDFFLENGRFSSLIDRIYRNQLMDLCTQ